MIQRKQSLYLLILALAAIIVSFSNTGVVDVLGAGTYDGQAIDKVSISYCKMSFYNQNNLISTLSPSKTQFILWAVALLSILALVSFKNRKRQITFCSFNFALIVFIPIFLYLDVYNVQALFNDGTIDIMISATFPIALLIMNFLAVRGIVKDHNLIKSMDRLR